MCGMRAFEFDLRMTVKLPHMCKGHVFIILYQRKYLVISNWTIWHRLEYERPFGFASLINAFIQDRLFSMLEIKDSRSDLNV